MGVIFGSRATVRSPRKGRGYPAWGSTARHLEPEGRPGTDGAVDADRSAMALDDDAAEVEADAEPTLRLGRGGAAHEAIEDPALLVIGDADAAIADGDARRRSCRSG